MIEFVLPNPTPAWNPNALWEMEMCSRAGTDSLVQKRMKPKKSLNAAGSAAGDSSRPQGCSSVAARTHTQSLAKYWSWIVWSLSTWKATESTQCMLFCAGVQLTTKQNIHWKETKHWGGDVKCTAIIFIFFTQSHLSLAPPTPTIFKRGKKAFSCHSHFHLESLIQSKLKNNKKPPTNPNPNSHPLGSLFSLASPKATLFSCNWETLTARRDWGKEEH